MVQCLHPGFGGDLVDPPKAVFDTLWNAQNRYLIAEWFRLQDEEQAVSTTKELG